MLNTKIHTHTHTRTQVKNIQQKLENIDKEISQKVENTEKRIAKIKKINVDDQSKRSKIQIILEKE